MDAKMKNEFEKFDRTMRKLMSVPHDAIKAQLDAEKKAKTRRKKRASRASGGSSHDSA